MNYYSLRTDVFSRSYITKIKDRILRCPYFAVNNLNRDFIGTKGFSVVFRRSGLGLVEQQFPFFKLYLDQALQPGCNAFYLNPLQLQGGSRVDPHIDRSLRSYCKTIEPPAQVSVLYIDVPNPMSGGELVLRHRKQQVGWIRPQINTLVLFQGNLTHSVNAMQADGIRLSLVCEQYELEEAHLEEIPEFTIESRIASSAQIR